MTDVKPHIAVIGAGIGGLAAALRLAHGGARVTVFERHAGPGGKMRTMPSAAGPVDAGPTVLTLKKVFEDLFAQTGSALHRHVTLQQEHVIARHFWPDGTTLDLTSDSAENKANIGRVFGRKSAEDFAKFDTRSAQLFAAFDEPIMQAADPKIVNLIAKVARNPALIPLIEGHRSLHSSLLKQFSEPKLAQLFGRYATYIGGRPDASPALLSLIWRAESQGVWHVSGGMHMLAKAIAQRAADCGAQFRYHAHVEQIEMAAGKPAAVVTAEGRTPIDAVLFNGDPRALRSGMLGKAVKAAIRQKGVTPRSLSACVHSFAAQAQGVPLAAHNVFFCADPHSEFDALAQDRMPQDATLYVCAQDRFSGQNPACLERFEIIANAPPVADGAPLHAKDREICHTAIMMRLKHFGLRFTPHPEIGSLTMPQQFSALFPASNGALYGRSPHGMMAAFNRPTVRSRIPGLYLVGGGIHPGAGVPMATLCAAHAAEAMLKDLSLTSTSHQAAMPGGTSTASQTMVPAPSLSSDS
ncbi:MAG: 1-hydroxycarotenoid 3,4-desaturase CrtD [Pseudomonadota bacterium]